MIKFGNEERFLRRLVKSESFSVAKKVLKLLLGSRIVVPSLRRLVVFHVSTVLICWLVGFFSRVLGNSFFFSFFPSQSSFNNL